MNGLLDESCHLTYSLRPKVHEVSAGEFRGYVDVIARRNGEVFSFDRYCALSHFSRDRAEFDAVKLAEELQLTDCADGRSWVLAEHRADAFVDKSIATFVPPSLLPVKSRRLTIAGVKKAA